MYFPDNSGNRQQQEGVEPVDPSALARALKDYETAGARRERTPVSSPCRKRQRVYGDRYVTLSMFWSPEGTPSTILVILMRNRS